MFRPNFYWILQTHNLWCRSAPGEKTVESKLSVNLLQSKNKNGKLLTVSLNNESSARWLQSDPEFREWYITEPSDQQEIQDGIWKLNLLLVLCNGLLDQVLYPSI